MPASVLLEREAFAREDDLWLAFRKHRSATVPIGTQLSEQELSLMLCEMVRSPSHLYNTSDSQVAEILWAMMNSLDWDADDDDDDAGKHPPAASFESAEAAVFHKLVATYNKLVDECLLLSKLKQRSLARQQQKERERDGRLSRICTAFQGEIGADGTVGDTGDIAGYRAVEAASELWKFGDEGLQSRVSVLALATGDAPALAPEMPLPRTPVTTDGAVGKRQAKRMARGSTPVQLRQQASQISASAHRSGMASNISNDQLAVPRARKSADEGIDDHDSDDDDSSAITSCADPRAQQGTATCALARQREASVY